LREAGHKSLHTYQPQGFRGADPATVGSKFTLELAVSETQLPGGRFFTGIIRDVISLLKPQIAGGGLEFSRSCTPRLSTRANRDKAGQILLNLITNAIKFTPPGGRIEVTGEGDAQRVYLRVHDTGRGIPPEMAESIFDPFVQVRDPLWRDTSRQGVGLGLAISRDLARAMGGDLTMTSKIGEGSTFTLSLPRCARVSTKRRKKRGVA
jgi:signal transduction histidine kinase